MDLLQRTASDHRTYSEGRRGQKNGMSFTGRYGLNKGLKTAGGIVKRDEEQQTRAPP